MKYFIYARKSSESEDRQVQSIDDQLERLDKLAKELGLTVVDRLTESKSAKQPNNRPVFEDMIQRIRKGDAEGILCWQINRLSRNPVDSGTIQWLLQKEILQSVRTFDREYRPNDNALILSVESGVANQFILDLRKNTIRGMERKVELGWMPNMAPLGYLNHVTDDETHIIIPDPDRFQIVRKMWDLMLTGTYTPRQIVDIANNEWGLTSRKMKRIGGNPLSYSGVYRIFNNAFYAGLFSYRKEWKQGAHEPMITLDEFDRVQRLLGKRGKPRPRTHEFSFTGMIRCGECGCNYTAQTKQKFIKSTKEVKHYTYYHCTNKKRDIDCTQRKNLRVENIEEQIERELIKITILPQFRDWALEVLGNEHEKEVKKRTQVYETQTKAYQMKQNEMDSLTKMRIKELINDEEYLKEKARIKSELEKYKSEIERTEQRAEKWIELTEQTFDFATYAHTRFLNGDVRTKREILNALGSDFEIIDGNLKIQLNEWFVPIAESYPELEKEYLRLEPNKNSQDKRKMEGISTIHSSWLRGWDSNPRPIG